MSERDHPEVVAERIPSRRILLYRFHSSSGAGFLHRTVLERSSSAGCVCARARAGKTRGPAT